MVDFILRVQRDYRDKVNNNGLKYHNLFDFCNSKAQEGDLNGTKNEKITEPEFRQALMMLEEDGAIN